MKTDKRKIKDKLDKVVKDIVKIRDESTCQHCFKVVSGSDCHGSHVIPVSRDGRLAFDPLNIKVLCYHCHLNWWHKHPVESGDWFTKTFPERWEYLENKYKENTKQGSIPIAWYKEQLEIYTEILKNYKNKVSNQ
jgi:5-methylcytosine-specific restriction endonuclease McrA